MYFQRPVGFGRSLFPTFQFTLLIEKSDIDVFTDISFVMRRRLRKDFLIFDRLVGFLFSWTSFFFVQSGHHFGQSFVLGCRPFFNFHYLFPVLKTEKPFGQGFVESFNDGLIPVNFGPPTSNENFVVFHLF